MSTLNELIRERNDLSDLNAKLLAALEQCAEQLNAETLGGEALDNAREAIAEARGQ